MTALCECGHIKSDHDGGHGRCRNIVTHRSAAMVLTGYCPCLEWRQASEGTRP